jgi:hypothetical protein
VAANRPAAGNELDIHFVNYNRDETQDPPKRGVEDERPIAVAQVKCDVVRPDSRNEGGSDHLKSRKS